MKPTHLVAVAVLATVTLGGFMCTPKRPPVSSVELRRKLDQKIVALNVELRDHRLSEVAQKVAMGEIDSEAEIVRAMAARSVPYVRWVLYQSESDDLDALVRSLRKLSPARCGMVDLPKETAICARAVVELNKVPTSSAEGGSFTVQGAAQGSARIEELLVMAPDGGLYSAELSKRDRAFDATFKVDRGPGLYTAEVLARTGRGIEVAARWWIEVGSAELPASLDRTPEAEDPKPSALVQQAFERLNADRTAVGASKIRWSAKLADQAGKRVQDYAKIGAVAPPDQELLAKLRVEGGRAVTGYSETLADGESMAVMAAEIMRSPSKRRGHLDPGLTSGAVAVSRDKEGLLYMVEVLGRSYDPNNAKELRSAIVERVNLARSRAGAAPMQVHGPLSKYAQQIAQKCMKRDRFYDKDSLNRTLADAILGDIDGLQFAGSEMFKVSGAEEVTPGATPTNKRFSQIGVGVARRKADLWWVVILAATPEDPK